MNQIIAIFFVSAFCSALVSASRDLPTPPGCSWTGCHSVRHASACPAALVAQNEDPNGCPQDHKRYLCCQPNDSGEIPPPALPPSSSEIKNSGTGIPSLPRPNPEQRTCQDYTYQQCVSHCQSLRG